MNLTYAGDYRSSLEASLTLTKAYLQKLKEAGVYDNSVIIVMADHGTNGEYYLEPMGRQNPILFVKGIGEQHAFEVSQAPFLMRIYRLHFNVFWMEMTAGKFLTIMRGMKDKEDIYNMQLMKRKLCMNM